MIAVKHWARIRYNGPDGPLVHVVSTLTDADAAVRLAEHWGQDNLHSEEFHQAEVEYLGRSFA